MTENTVISILSGIIVEAISKLWGMPIEKEDIKIIDLQQKLNELILKGEIEVEGKEEEAIITKES